MKRDPKFLDNMQKFYGAEYTTASSTTPMNKQSSAFA